MGGLIERRYYPIDKGGFSQLTIDSVLKSAFGKLI